MNIENLLVIASFSLQSLLSVLGILIWHEFKRLQLKVDVLATHKLDCIGIFASKENQQRIWKKIEQNENRIQRLETKVRAETKVQTETKVRIATKIHDETKAHKDKSCG